MNNSKRSMLAMAVLLTTGCSSTLPTDPPAAAPTEPNESIHTLVRQIHLDYGKKQKTSAWNEIEETSIGLHSTESVDFAGARSAFTNSSPAVGSPFQRVQSHNTNEKAIQDQVLVSQLQRMKNIKQFERNIKEFDNMLNTVSTYCKDAKQGQLYQINLENNEKALAHAKPLNHNELTRQSHRRLMCVTGSEPPFALPFFVDIHDEELREADARIHLSATIPEPSIGNVMMAQWRPPEP